MRRRTMVWLLSVPLMALGSEAAHWLAYRLVYPEAHVRVLALIASGHSYSAYAPMAFGILGALELVTLVGLAVESARGRHQSAVPMWAFALLPPLGFTLQELTERFLHAGAFPWWTVLEPTFRIGLLLQIPLGLLMYLLARLLLRAARAVGVALRAGLRVPRVAVRQAVWSAADPFLPRLGVRARGWSERGPPLPLV